MSWRENGAFGAGSCPIVKRTQLRRHKLEMEGSLPLYHIAVLLRTSQADLLVN